MTGTKIQLRRDIALNWTNVNPILADGEVGIEREVTFTPNVVIEFPSMGTISNNTLTIAGKQSGLTDDQIDYSIHTNEPAPLGRTASPYFDCRFRIKFVESSEEWDCIFRQYTAQEFTNDYWDVSFNIHRGSYNELTFTYNNWGNNVHCSLPSDYVGKYYTYRVFMASPSTVPTVQVIDDNETVVSQATAQEPITFREPASLEGMYTAIGCGSDCTMVGEVDLVHSSMSFKNGTWNWTGVSASAGNSTKFKVGNGTSTWNQLDYFMGDMQSTTNLVTSISSSSTDTEYPSAKLVYDQLGTKQATLVSGTNIKTINSTSLLGSGNVAVQETLVSGTNIKTINNESLLGNGNVSTTQVIIRDWA